MRNDFGKCVIERPRRGSSNPSPKARMFGRYNEDGEYEGPIKIPSGMGYAERITGYSGKDFSDLLGPINNYLQSSVGKYWPKVYSELSQQLGRASWPLRHILLQHVDVAVNTYRGVDGKVWHNDKRGPEVVDGSYGTEFYVHPETKTLRRFIKPKKQKRKSVGRPIEKYDAGDGRCLVHVNGSWFLGTYELVKRVYVPGTSPSHKIYDVKWPDYREHEWDYDYFRFTWIKSASKKEKKQIMGKQ